MTSPFSRFTDRMIAAEDEPSRRELLAEIGRWRAGHLTDVTALRDAAFAMARLHMLLGQRNQALHEGQSLVSLCQTPPEVSQEDWEAATAFLATLGGTPPKKRLGAQPPRDRSRRKSKGSDGRSEDAKVAALRPEAWRALVDGGRVAEDRPAGWGGGGGVDGFDDMELI